MQNRKPAFKGRGKKANGPYKKPVNNRAKRTSSVNWDPLRDSRYQKTNDESDQPAMGIEERKAAQLAKWKKELGLSDES